MKCLVLTLLIFCSAIPLFAQTEYDTMDSLAVSVQQHAQMENYDQAIAGLNELLALLEKNNEQAAYAGNMLFLARLFEVNKEYANAIQSYKTSARLIEQLYGITEELGTVYGGLAICYITNRQFDEGIQAYRKAIKVYDSIIIEDYENYLGLLYSVRSDLQMNNYYSEEELHIAEREATAAREYYGANNPKYAEVMADIGMSFLYTGEYEACYPYLLTALDVYKSLGEYYGEEYLEVLEDVGMYHFSVADYQEAEATAFRIMQLTKEYYGEQSENTASVHNRLAKIYIGTGEYGLAEEHLHTAINMQKQINPNTRDYTAYLHNLAMLYAKLGNDLQAYRQFVVAIKSAEQQGETENLGYAKLLASLGAIKGRVGFLESARDDLKSAIQLHEEVLGPGNVMLPDLYAQLANVYYKMPLTDSVIWSLQQADAITEKIYDKDELGYAAVLDHKMHIYDLRNMPDSAAVIALQNYELLKKTAGDRHPDYYNGLYMLARAYARTGHPETQQWINKTVAADKQQLADKLTFLSGDELLAYISGVMYKTNSLLAYGTQNHKALSATLFNNLLLLKGASLKNSNDVFLSIKKSGDTGLLETYSRWAFMRRELAQQYTLPKDRRTVNVDSLEKGAQKLEKNLVKQSAEFRNTDALLQTSWKQVQSKLKAGEAAVEFVSYDTWYVNGADSVIYAALVLRPGDKQPVFVPLCSQAQLGRLLGSATPKQMFNTRTMSLLDEKVTDPRSYGDSLYRVIWGPLVPYLGKSSTVYYSPDGLLHQVAFSALPVNDSVLLMDKYRLVQLLSLRQITESVGARAKDGSITIFGGIDYEGDEDSANADTALGILPEDRGAGSFSFLPGTLDEAGAISNLYNKNGGQAVLYTGKQATEESFKALSGNSPVILHLATHGFFIPQSDKAQNKSGFETGENAFKLANDPLMRGGLLMAGGNRAWQGLPVKGREDGVLTAYEVAGLDLTNTGLVVLSACQTGLGEVQGTEGVFGLQRAFKMAGVQAMLMSLWSVPDKETKELMELFYSNYIKSNNVRQAFEAAQKAMRAQYPPYYWAAFVMVE